MRRMLIDVAVFALLATTLYAQTPADPAPAVPTNTPAGVDEGTMALLAMAALIVKNLQGGQQLAALSTAIALITAVLRRPWGQALLAKIGQAEAQWKCGPQQVLTMLMVVSVGFTYLVVPHTEWYKVVGKGVYAGLAACGGYEIVKNFIIAKTATEVVE